MTVHCTLCGSARKSLVRARLRHGIRRKVFRCGTCGMVYLEPQKMRAFYAGKEYRKRYGPVLGKETATKTIFTLYSPFQAPIVDRIRPLLRKHMAVLDVGSSAGQFLHALKGLVKKRVGLELSKEAVAFSRKKLGVPIYDVPIEEAVIKEGPFDLITCLQTLEHVEDPVGFLKHLGKNLKPNGYLYLELPNIDDALISVYKNAGYADFYYREPHVSYFSKKTLGDALKKAGFKGVIKTVQRYNILNHIHWLQNGTPQSDFRAGNLPPVLVKDPKDKTARALNTFIQQADVQYKTLIETQGLGESLTFLGQGV